MSFDWSKLTSALLQTEENLLPIFVHNPQSQAIAGAILVTESVFASIFTPPPVLPVPATGSTAAQQAAAAMGHPDNLTPPAPVATQPTVIPQSDLPVGTVKPKADSAALPKPAKDLNKG